jgi:hypothetical protein
MCAIVVNFVRFVTRLSRLLQNPLAFGLPP